MIKAGHSSENSSDAIPTDILTSLEDITFEINLLTELMSVVAVVGTAVQGSLPISTSEPVH